MEKYNNTSYAAQLAILKGLTEHTGVLQEAQVLQLKLWGIVIFQHVPPSRWQCEVSVTEKVVSYYLYGKNKKPKKYQNLIKGLDRSIKFMLGDSWKLNVFENDILFYDGNKTIKVKKSKDE